MRIKNWSFFFMDELHSCESILPPLDVLNDRAMRPKTLSMDVSYCVDPVTRHPEKFGDHGHWPKQTS